VLGLSGAIRLGDSSQLGSSRRAHPSSADPRIRVCRNRAKLSRPPDRSSRSPSDRFAAGIRSDEQPAFSSPRDRLAPAASTELLVNVLDMRLHRAPAAAEFPRDRVESQVRRQQAKHPQLSGRQAKIPSGEPLLLSLARHNEISLSRPRRDFLRPKWPKFRLASAARIPGGCPRDRAPRWPLTPSTARCRGR
jgi:hypothetical protein